MSTPQNNPDVPEEQQETYLHPSIYAAFPHLRRIVFGSIRSLEETFLVAPTGDEENKDDNNPSPPTKLSDADMAMLQQALYWMRHDLVWITLAAGKQAEDYVELSKMAHQSRQQAVQAMATCRAALEQNENMQRLAADQFATIAAQNQTIQDLQQELSGCNKVKDAASLYNSSSTRDEKSLSSNNDGVRKDPEEGDYSILCSLMQHSKEISIFEDLAPDEGTSTKHAASLTSEIFAGEEPSSEAASPSKNYKSIASTVTPTTESKDHVSMEGSLSSLEEKPTKEDTVGVDFTPTASSTGTPVAATKTTTTLNFEEFRDADATSGSTKAFKDSEQTENVVQKESRKRLRSDKDASVTITKKDINRKEAVATGTAKSGKRPCRHVAKTKKAPEEASRDEETSTV